MPLPRARSSLDLQQGLKRPRIQADWCPHRVQIPTPDAYECSCMRMCGSVRGRTRACADARRDARSSQQQAHHNMIWGMVDENKDPTFFSPKNVGSLFYLLPTKGNKEAVVNHARGWRIVSLLACVSSGCVRHTHPLAHTYTHTQGLCTRVFVRVGSCRVVQLRDTQLHARIKHAKYQEARWQRGLHTTNSANCTQTINTKWESEHENNYHSHHANIRLRSNYLDIHCIERGFVSSGINGLIHPRTHHLLFWLSSQ